MKKRHTIALELYLVYVGATTAEEIQVLTEIFNHDNKKAIRRRNQFLRMADKAILLLSK